MRIKRIYHDSASSYGLLCEDSIYSLFSSLTGYCISSVRPKEGVIWPFKIAATPEMIGNLKSKILGSTFVISSCCSASVVATPSVVSLVAKMSSSVSPLARRTPTCLL